MTEIDNHLNAAQAALLAGQPGLAETAITALEKALAAAPPGAEDAARYRGGVQRLIALSAAAADGTAAANRWLREALKLAGSLETYTAAGRRSVDVFPAQRSGRF